jgi:hypothetical protein
MLAFALPFAGPAMAQSAGNAVGADGQPRHRFATVWRLSGTLTSSFDKATAARVLRVGDAVYVGDRLEVQPDSEAVLQTEDSGYVAMRPGVRFSMDEYVADKNASDRFTLRLLQGSLRVISGWVAKLHPQAYRIITPSATVGIRGTDHETYVLTEELAQALRQTAGTYDKVNSGGTSLATLGGSVDIVPGKVGFARLTSPRKTRALITLILPVILDKVPDFYVPGRFDAELDALAQTGTPNTTPGGPATRSTDAATSPTALATSSSATTAAATPATRPNGQCNAQAVAASWLALLDGAIARNDAQAVLALFALDAEVSGTLLGKIGTSTTISMSREEFAAGSLAALNSLTNYQQKRLSVSTSVNSKAARPEACNTVTVTSSVIEQGEQAGKPYRFKTLERYQLELKDGHWLAVKAQTRQQ